MSLTIGTLNDRQSQIEQEKRANEHHWHEKEDGQWWVRLLIHDHDLWPAFESDTLEDVEKSPENVVKVCHIVVRIEGRLATIVTYRTLGGATEHLFAAVVEQKVSWYLVDTALFELAHEQVESTDGKDEEKEEQDRNSVLEHGYGLHHWLDNTLKSLNIVHETKGSQDAKGTQTAERSISATDQFEIGRCHADKI